LQTESNNNININRSYLAYCHIMADLLQVVLRCCKCNKNTKYRYFHVSLLQKCYILPKAQFSLPLGIVKCEIIDEYSIRVGDDNVDIRPCGLYHSAQIALHSNFWRIACIWFWLYMRNFLNNCSDIETN